MNLPISHRLLACCSFITPGERVADIGCDHGYLGIYLLSKGIASSVIAADINKQPLESAVRNANKFDVADKMSFHLSDGAKDIPKDFDTLVCAGMGADTMISILKSAPWLQDDRYHMIMQCQSKTPTLRRYLSENGWHIRKESVLRDGRFLYTVMEVVWHPGVSLTPGACYFPPALLHNPTKETAEYWRRTVEKLNRAVSGRGEHADAFLITALEELSAMADTPMLKWLKEDCNDNNS